MICPIWCRIFMILALFGIYECFISWRKKMIVDIRMFQICAQIYTCNKNKIDIWVCKIQLVEI